jgi:hypothetical protein
MIRSAVVAVLAIACLTGCDHDSLTINRPSVAPAFSAPRGGRTAASLDVTSGFSSVDVRVANIGDELFRVNNIPAAGVYPVATVSGDTVVITSAGSGSGAMPAQVLLSPAVTWTITLAGGASLATVDLTGGHASSVQITAGVSSMQLTLPPAAGTVAVTMSGGASEFRVHLGGPDAVRATLAGGASLATIDGVTHTGIAGGSVFASPDWADATDRYDIDCAAGVSSLVIDRT